VQFDSFSDDRHNEISDTEIEVDRLTDSLSRYMVELLPHLQSEYHVNILNQYYKVSTEFERLGDQAMRIADIAKKMAAEKTQFSETCKTELVPLKALIEDMLDDTEKAFTVRDVEAASVIEPKVRVAGELIDELIKNHFIRMSAGECSMLADAAFSNLMGEYKRISSVCSNVGIATLVRIRPELASNEHLFFESLNKGNDESYRSVYEKTKQAYRIPSA
jgi:phosphate:Na+ symporter